MPFATFAKVREVSSEDSVHLAENLIKGQHDKKWKTKNAGEKSAYVILEMTGSYQITGIDIGNEHSAFVEVFVGKSACAPEDFKEILITCSFMTPPESKSSNNINRVRCFNKDALVPSVAEEKWSLVKILCTQPFNKHVAYGLSFIKVHIIDDTKHSSITEKNLVLAQENPIGKLKFRESSPDSESENKSSLFNRWKKSKLNDEEQTTAASIRLASKQGITLASSRFNDDQKSKTSASLRENDNILDRNREELLFGDKPDETNYRNKEKLERLSKQIDADKKRRCSEIKEEVNKKKRKSLDSSLKSESNLAAKPPNSHMLDESKNIDSDSIKKQQKTNRSPHNPIKKVTLSRKCKPFNQLLKDVVLVISGIQNPERGDLRNKAIALGAKYKADWDDTCTHLICAFKNTPKYNQVKGVGKIVTRSWIEKCYTSRKYLPWRRYALDSKDLTKPESDEEIFEENAQAEETVNNCDLQNKSLNKSREAEEKDNTLALYGFDDKSKANNTSNHNSSSSESDTDDEIKRIQQGSKATKLNAKPLDIYEVSTDEEEYLAEKNSQIE